MDQLQKMEQMSFRNNLQLTTNDRLFYSKYLYRLTIGIYAYKYPDLMNVGTIDENAFKVDSEQKINFLHAIRIYANKHQDRTRLESKILTYYTNELTRLEDIVKYVNRLKEKQIIHNETLLDLVELKYFPGNQSERNIRYRKKRLPYNKFKFQLLGERMETDEYCEWENWAKQYPDDIKLPTTKYNKQWGTWAGEPIGYVSSEKVLQLIHFKLGPKINKIIEFQIKDISNETRTISNVS